MLSGSSPQARCPPIKTGPNWRWTNSFAAPWSGWMERRGRSKPRMRVGACRLQPKAASGRCPIRCFSCSPNGCQRRGRPAEAAYLEALAIRRRLAEANPEAYFPYLANSLNNLANLYNDAQRMTEPETAHVEALSTRRRAQRILTASCGCLSLSAWRDEFKLCRSNANRASGARRQLQAQLREAPHALLRDRSMRGLVGGVRTEAHDILFLRRRRHVDNGFVAFPDQLHQADGVVDFLACDFHHFGPRPIGARPERRLEL